MKKITSIIVIVISVICSLNAQNNNCLWKSVSEKEIKITGKRDIVPTKFKTFHLDLNSLKKTVAEAPLYNTTLIDQSTATVSIPMPNGTIQNFKVVESPVMEESLQLNYPNIRTYNIKGIDDQYANGKIDVTEFGFHAMIRSPKGDVFIDPYCKWNVNDYITYYAADFFKPENEKSTEIGLTNTINHTNYKIATPSAICSGANLRTYRLGLGCTGEYAIAATGTASPTIAQTLAKVVTTINRVDGVYETEVAVKLILANTTTLTLYTKTLTTTAIVAAPIATAQPFTGNNNGSVLINQIPNILNTLIGSSNYDIGHAFSTGGGGVASLGCVCGTNKANGITGQRNPTGDPYDIDYVAHEIGHQFGGNHTFNGNTGSCSLGNRNASTAVEPGSGVTIMAYAGICSPQNITANSIAYFHSLSYDEITNYTRYGNGNSCPITTTTGNTPPLVSPVASYTVPKSTPFQLTGSATDADGDALTYQWEEFDIGTVEGNWNNGSKPFFRSYAPVISPTRLFPNLASILANNYTTTVGEYLPNTNQTLNFRLNVRDNKMGGGGVCSTTNQITIDPTSGPFAITSQSVTGLIYPSGSTQLISWNVNGTNAAPINCNYVNIYVSLDNGTTFSLSVSNTLNDGAEDILIPEVLNDMLECRVKVESVGNVFFDINKKAFRISASTNLNQYNSGFGFNVSVFPNPVSSELVTININASQFINEHKTTINIYDILGNMVKSENIKLTKNFSKELDFSSLSNGTYIIEVTDGTQKTVARLIKI